MSGDGEEDEDGGEVDGDEVCGCLLQPKNQGFSVLCVWIVDISQQVDVFAELPQHEGIQGSNQM